jgi:hypothetical protein
MSVYTERTEKLKMRTKFLPENLKERDHGGNAVIDETHWEFMM